MSLPTMIIDLVAVAVPNPQPSPGGIPGQKSFLELLASAKWIILGITVAVMGAGALLWQLSNHGGNPQRASVGKGMFFGGFLTAFATGSAALYVTFFYNSGAAA